MGSEISVPCGTSVKYGTPIHCVSCQLGKTYSEEYDKAQCKACTICSTGKALVKNCTLVSNTRCSTECQKGFYSFPFSFACWPCSNCCHDGKDELPKECSGNYLKKCKMRSSPCSYVHSTNTPGTTAKRIPWGPTQMSLQRDAPTPFPTKEGEKVTSPAFSTYSVEFPRSRIDQSITTTKSTKSPKEGSGNEVLLILSGAGVALGITVLFALTVVMSRHGWFCRPCFLRWGKSENSVEFPPAQIEVKPALSQEELRLGELLYRPKLTE